MGIPPSIPPDGNGRIPDMVGVSYNLGYALPQFGPQYTDPVTGQIISPIHNAPVDGSRRTYSGGINGLVPVASATDIFTITGSATQTVRVTRISIAGIATTILDTTVRLLLRTTADTAGTKTNPALYPHDSNNAAATAVLAAYTANPTVNDGTDRVIRAAKLLFNLAAPTAASESGRLVWDFGNRPPGQAFVLRGVAQQLAINLNGVSVAGGSIDISVELTEDSYS